MYAALLGGVQFSGNLVILSRNGKPQPGLAKNNPVQNEIVSILHRITRAYLPMFYKSSDFTQTI
jgi:hypothetical protein